MEFWSHITSFRRLWDCQFVQKCYNNKDLVLYTYINIQSVPVLCSRPKSVPGEMICIKRYKGCEYRFVDPPTPELYCQKCYEIACEPQQVKCSCPRSLLFCKLCVPSQCHNCKCSYVIFPDGLNHKRIQELKIKCPNNTVSWWDLECSWEGELQTVIQHRLVCPRERVPCPYKVIGCKQIIPKDSLKKDSKESRETHLNLAMEKVVSMVAAMKELTATVENLQLQIKDIQQQMNHSPN